MNKNKPLSNYVNLIKVVINHYARRPFRSLGRYYDSRYPLTKFLKWNLPKVEIQCILCGYPRCGTHWIRNVVEKSTGENTYDLIENKPTPSDKNIRLLKVHARNKFVARLKALISLPRHKFTGKYIYLYRDPRDAVISFYEFENKRNSDGLKPEDFLKIYDPIGQYRWEINAWALKKHKNVLLVRFEDLKAHPMEMLKEIFDYLNIDNPVEGEFIDEKVAAVDSKNRPRGTAYAWKNAQGEYKYIVDKVNKELTREIQLLGYDGGGQN